jgi:hypothetical protein
MVGGRKGDTPVDKIYEQNAPRGNFHERRDEAAMGVWQRLKAMASLIALLCITSMPVCAQESFRGEWTIKFTRNSADAQLTLYSHSAVSGNGMSSVTLSSEKLQGLTNAQAFSANAPCSFSLKREAGTITFEGCIKDGRGAGQWKLAPDQKFIADMRGLGYDELQEHQLQAATIYDLSTKYIADLKTVGYDHLSMYQLIGARIFNISAARIEDIQRLDFKRVPLDKLISMQIFSVSTDFIRELRAQGYNNLSVDELIRMRINGVTPELISELRAQGYSDVSVEDLVRVSLFGINGDFISRLRGRGLKDLTIAQLVHLRMYRGAR